MTNTGRRTGSLLVVAGFALLCLGTSKRSAETIDRGDGAARPGGADAGRPIRPTGAAAGDDHDEDEDDEDDIFFPRDLRPRRIELHEVVRGTVSRDDPRLNGEDTPKGFSGWMRGDIYTIALDPGDYTVDVRPPEWESWKGIPKRPKDAPAFDFQLVAGEPRPKGSIGRFAFEALNTTGGLSVYQVFHRSIFHIMKGGIHTILLWGRVDKDVWYEKPGFGPYELRVLPGAHRECLDDGPQCVPPIPPRRSAPSRLPSRH
jgi:hypothetical protein